MMKAQVMLFTVLLLLLVGRSESHKIFNANVTIRVPNGQYSASLYYLYNDTAGSNYHVMRLDYTYPLSMVDLINYGEGVRYKYCTKCEAGFYSGCKNNYIYIIIKLTDEHFIYNYFTHFYIYLRRPEDVQTQF